MAKPKYAKVPRDADGREASPRGKSRRETPNQTPGTAEGGWSRNDRKVQCREARRPVRNPEGCSCAGFPRGNRPVRRARRAGVRASIVAMKPGNAGGAKGRMGSG